MSSRNSDRLARVLILIVSAAAAWAQPPKPPPAAGTALLSGSVTNSATGAPVPGARVSLVVSLGGVDGRQTLSTTTDAEGKFSFSGLPAGRFNIGVNRVGFVVPASGNRLPNTQLRPDSKIEDLKLILTPTGAISGRVLNSDGAPVQGAIVSLDAALFGINPTTSDEKGQFRISGVPPGRYRVAANPAIMPFPPEIRTDGTREVHLARTYYPDGLTVKAGQRVEVAAGAEVMGTDVRLARTPVVTLSGRVVDLPAGGKTVVRAIASAETGGGVLMANNVKPDGSFQIWQLDPGKYTVVATNTSQGPGPQRSLQSMPVDIEVAGVDIEHLELRIIQPFDVSAQLAFDDAKAREGLVQRRLMLRPEGPIFGYGGSSNFQPIAIGTDDSLTWEKLQPGRYRVTPMWGVYVKSVTVGPTETDGDILDLHNGPAGAVKITVGSLSGELSGVVSDASGPAAGVRVVLLSDRGPMLAYSAPDGAYKFPAVAPGKYKLIAVDSDIPRNMVEDADTAESIEIRPGDKLTRALKKQSF
jgi:hypothetical protein